MTQPQSTEPLVYYMMKYSSNRNYNIQECKYLAVSTSQKEVGVVNGFWSTSDKIQWHIHDGIYKDDRETFVVMSSTVSMKTISSVSSFSAITVYKGTHNKNNKLLICNSLSTEGCILHLHVLQECYNISSLPQGKFNI